MHELHKCLIHYTLPNNFMCLQTMEESENLNCCVNSDGDLLLYGHVNYSIEYSNDHSNFKNAIAAEIEVLPHCIKPEVSESKLTS